MTIYDQSYKQYYIANNKYLLFRDLHILKQQHTVHQKYKFFLNIRSLNLNPVIGTSIPEEPSLAKR